MWCAYCLLPSLKATEHPSDIFAVGFEELVDLKPSAIVHTRYSLQLSLSFPPAPPSTHFSHPILHLLSPVSPCLPSLPLPPPASLSLPLAPYSSTNRKEWGAELERVLSLNTPYILLTAEQMVGICLYVFIRPHLVPFIRQVLLAVHMPTGAWH